MNRHTVSDKNPVYVNGAERYRVSFTGYLKPTHPKFKAMEERIPREGRRSDGYGLAFLESEEHSVAYYGSISSIDQYKATSGDETATLNPSRGFWVEGWPTGDGWDDYIPNNTWNSSGEGIVTEFAHPRGGKVVVYEFTTVKDGGEKMAMVGFHCDRCHPDPKIDYQSTISNEGPASRRWMGRNARVHVRDHATECRPVDPLLAETVTAIANEKYGTRNPMLTWESRCATEGPCAKIREFKARV